MIKVDIRADSMDAEQVAGIIEYLKRTGFQETFRWSPASAQAVRVVLTCPTRSLLERMKREEA